MKIQYKVLLALLLVIVAAFLISPPICREENEHPLPVLMYHHFAQEVSADTVVSPERFREQMTALKNAGYTTVTVQDILDFVDHGRALPEKAILITMDDGYTSNLTEAAPILEELGMCATVFPIGIYEGEQVSVHSGNTLYPARFSYEDALPWIEKGVLDLQTHTFDMHQHAEDGFSGRNGLLPLPDESMVEYRAALLRDAQAAAQRRAEHGLDTAPVALAYPYGYYCPASCAFLREAGIRITFTVIERNNILRTGDQNSLWDLGRYNVTERDSAEILLRRLK